MEYFKNVLSSFRIETKDGKEYLVVNGVPVKETVLNGRFLSAEQIAPTVHDWNGVPIVMRHPKSNGGSAKVPFPDVPVVGNFYASKMDGKRLVGEYWILKSALESSEDGKVILKSINSDTPVETSTGYWSQTFPESGKYNGIDYSYVDKNLHPDHIALLPDEIGACSVKDGCGMNRNSDCDTCPKKVKENSATGSTEQKVQEVRNAFYDKFRGEPGNSRDIYVESTFLDEKYLIAEEGSKLYKIPYSWQNGEIEFPAESEWTNVVRVESYVTVNGLQENVTGSLPAAGKKIYEAVYQSYKDKGMSDADAAKRAWGAVKKAGWKQDKEGKWHKNQQNQQALESFAVALLIADTL